MHDSANEPSTPPTEPGIVQSKFAFPVVGIGASAGGLQALIQLFENMPNGNDMAFVVILHLSPTHESFADDVLQRATRMPVCQVVKPVLLECGHVYVIAPNQQLSMVDGYLSVRDLNRPRGGHVAIDIFFRTLAEVHSERAVAIILSGTGSDGAVGITRIKEQGGITLAQEPGDAEHDGMPQAAIRTGMVDFVLPVTDMPQKLLDLWENARSIQMPATGDGEAPIAHAPDAAHANDAEAALQYILTQLCLNTSHDFRHYKRATVLRRIERRLQVCGVQTLPEYRALLDSDGREYNALLADMLIGVTNFFRDREAFETFERDIVPELFKDKTPTDEVRAWTVACSTGEEAYSVAMLLSEHAAGMQQPPHIQVFASDIDEHGITQARTGAYPASIITDVAPVRLRQYFTKEGDRYQIRKSLRDSILFARHNVLRDPPFSRLDVITCRNLLIYLNRNIQVQVLQMFHFALKPGGYLFLGSSESAESVAEYFIPVDKKNRIYRARPAARSPAQREHGPVISHIHRRAELGARMPQARQFSYAEVHQRALAAQAAPSVLLDSELNIVHMTNSAGRFLRMSGGEPSRNILALVLPELRLELRSALYQVQQSSGDISCRHIAVERDGVNTLISMRALLHRDEGSASSVMLVLFEEVAPALEYGKVADARTDDVVLMRLEEELQRTKEQLQETIEHAEISTEELRASNEELQAINEELRSATEELETSKEEAQSINEELFTVNYELKVKVEETGKANDDLKNLIMSTDIATVFVDSAMRIKRYTPRAADIFSIIDTDVGRSLLDLSHKLDYDNLAADVHTTFETLHSVEREIRSHDGHYYIVRLQPYRTTEDRIEGAVMTFFDISGRRHAEEQVRASEARMKLVAESTMDYAIITTDGGGRVISWNHGAERIFGYTEEEMRGNTLDRLFVAEDRELHALDDELRRARDEGRAEDERWHLRKDGSRLFCSGITTPLGPNAMHGYAKIARDQTDRMRQDHIREGVLHVEQQGRSAAENVAATKDEFLAIMAHELRQPLNMINVHNELLARLPDMRASALGVRSTGAIRTSVLSQAKIIEDLLDMSRVRTGKMSLSLAPLDLGGVVQAIAEVARADELEIKPLIKVHGCDQGWMILADAVRIEQVVMNLLSNAIKFTPVHGEIGLSLYRDGDRVRLDVKDTGQGIAPAAQARIFEMFGQPNSITTRAKGGLGIGLAVVRELVTLHSGKIEVYSEGIGRGTRFSVSFPLLENQAALPDCADCAPAGVAGIRILLVDDAPDVVMLMKELLEMDGAEVYVATTALDALAVLEQQQIEILVSDISMPDIDGYELLRRVHKMARYTHLPAVAVSGLGREQDIARAREAGFSAHIGKPLQLDKMMAIVTKLALTSRRQAGRGAN